jgi:bifunctional isochorismate lyase / aryl carrier protein
MVKCNESYVTLSNVAEKAAAWLGEVRGAVRPRPNLVLRPGSAALLLIDMVNYFASPTGEAYLPASEAAQLQLTKLLPVWRKAGGTVVFTRHGHDGPHDTGMLGQFFSDYIRWESSASRIVEGLQPADGDLVFRKRTYDAFHETELESQLRDRGITQVLIGGVLTHMCCATTARSAFVRGLATHLLVDGMATSTERLHLAALHTLADSVAIVHATSEVIHRWQ